MKNIIKNRTLQFIFSLTVSTLLFLFSSYIVLVDNYKNIEKSQNLKNITALINSIEKDLSANDKALKLLAISEKTNRFIKTQKDYFSKELLTYLNIDLLLIEKSGKKILSKQASNIKIKNLTYLENKIFSIYKKQANFSVLKQIDDKLLYISKTKIKNHFIYIIKELNEKNLKKLAVNFNTISRIREHIYAKDSSFKLKSKSFKTVHIENLFTSTENINKISFYDSNNAYLFSLQTVDNRTIVNEAKSTIFIFTVAVIVFLIILFYITYMYQKIVNSHNESLEQKVEERTKQIRFTLSELEKANLKLYDIAHTDFLTKSMNRRNFFSHAQNYFKKAKSVNEKFCVVMIDLDNFKLINDNYGHNIGDKVLISFATCVKQTLEKEAIFGRLGGEEFAILFKNTTLNEAIEKTEKIRQAIEKVKIRTTKELINITASFGVNDCKACSSIDEMLQKADRHLYSAKKSGKNRVRGRV